MENKKRIILTIDDGPHPFYTPQILKILREYKIPAIFFVCGKNIKRYPEVLKMIHDAHQTIGNHTFSHSFIKTILGLNFQEIVATQELIEQVAPGGRKLYRPPWGIIPFWLTIKLKKIGFKIIKFDIVGYDWQKNISAKAISENISKKAKNGGIILLHDGKEASKNVNRQSTVDSLPLVIVTLRKKGYEFARLV